MSESGAVLQTLIALIFVLCLFGLCAVTARRFLPALTQRVAGRNRRLELVEILPLDARHRAVLLRCDAREHLLVVGEGGVTLIEQPTPSRETQP